MLSAFKKSFMKFTKKLCCKPSSVAQSCPTLSDPMDCSTLGLPVHHQPSELVHTHVHWVSDAIQPSHPLSSASPPTFNLSQNQGLFQWVGSFHQVGKVLGVPTSASVLPMNIQDWSPLRRRQWHPTPVLLPGKSHGWRSLEGCRPWGRWGSDTTEQLHFHFSLSRIGEGNGNPLQCSCLENLRDGGAWWAAVYGVARGWIRLKWLSSSGRH